MDYLIEENPNGSEHLVGDWVLIANEVHLDNPATGCLAVESNAPRQPAVAGMPLCVVCGSRLLRALDPKLGGDNSRSSQP